MPTPPNETIELRAQQLDRTRLGLEKFSVASSSSPAGLEAFCELSLDVSLLLSTTTRLH
jgi:hypothetical protein